MLLAVCVCSFIALKHLSFDGMQLLTLMSFALKPLELDAANAKSYSIDDSYMNSPGVILIRAVIYASRVVWCGCVHNA